jgi:hypothetical protein
MRSNQPVAGQYWYKEGREMSATSRPLEGMDNEKESVALAAIVEAVAWRHARIIIPDLLGQPPTGCLAASETSP